MTFKQTLRACLLPGALALAALAAGCDLIPPPQTDPTQYFILGAPPGAPSVESPSAGGLRLGLRPVVLEPYLRSRSIVVRLGPNQVDFRDYRRWAEPLDAASVQAIRTALVGSAAVSQVYLQPFPVGQPRDYDVTVTLIRCEGAAEGNGRFVASFAASVEISAAGTTPHVISRKVFTAPDRRWDGQDFGALAGLLSEDVADLSKEILAELPARE